MGKVVPQNLSSSNEEFDLSISSSGTLKLGGFFCVKISELPTMYLRDASIAMESWEKVAVLPKMH